MSELRAELVAAFRSVAPDAAEVLADTAIAVMQANHEDAMFQFGFTPGPISGGRDHWVSRAHPYDPALDPPNGALVAGGQNDS
ncbi:MAG TPA: hypothetical protein VHD87_15085 [Acidimicrobiales bacterium]|nr:hypothetical protein [Acidimicrobiales bacterium]